VGAIFLADKPFSLPSSLLFASEVLSRLAKWEYKVIPIRTQIHSDHYHADRSPVMDDVQKDLTALGNEGWELVGIQDTTLPDGRMFTVAYLKKEKP